MKKILCYLLIASMLIVSCVGCNNQTKESDKIETKVEKTDKQDKVSDDVKETEDTTVTETQNDDSTKQENTKSTTTKQSTSQNNSSKHKHTYSKTVTQPTCTVQGFTTYTCSCGDTYKDNYTSAKGHTEVIDEAVEATTTSTGLTEGKHCSVCGTILVAQTVIPKRSAAENSTVTEYHGGSSSGTYRTYSTSGNTLYNEWIIENVQIVKEDTSDGKFKMTVTITVQIVNQVSGCPNNIRGEYLFVRDGKNTAGGGSFVKTGCEQGKSYQITFTEYGFTEGSYKLTFMSNI